ncbi:MAG: hypothetical protein WC807_09180 [Hyphomicrobium sp.]|jgi:hypothetical protein|uniref:hypothetical protein n=1 Tax=Hyphomicrobium sp. DMF-1 TaxID=3019544 RepID=UPI000BC927D7|nr:hypothetical protein [Hyphomicrobium sp. DMF-1]MBN8913052.1 hypothetical protein [Hyphomicrobiales bacterium]OYW53692.1 MAG: hypothetical protein B7Z29_14665 [Hyphomicrobium sp. 12-62-95]OYX98426.1 MAG: hypothetical protein B7Y80_15435 [Hyphomicrobium sp. 32-62-53]WBT37943.1 hypothetical protein PE058_20145 [Hyphomicrobium sp. DMF-1]
MNAITTLAMIRRNQAVAGVILSDLAENRAKYVISAGKLHVGSEFVKSSAVTATSLTLKCGLTMTDEQT